MIWIFIVGVLAAFAGGIYCGAVLAGKGLVKKVIELYGGDGQKAARALEAVGIK